MTDIVLIIFKILVFIAQTSTCVVLIFAVKECIYQRKHCLVSSTGIRRAYMHIKARREKISQDEDSKFFGDVIKAFDEAMEMIREECPEVKDFQIVSMEKKKDVSES